MKFFIDTANLNEIAEAQALGILDGVTTNPSLMAKEGITGADNILKHYFAICNLVDGDVSAEVIATDFEGMVREGEILAALHPQIVVKLPMIAAGVKACKYFSDKGIRTNVRWYFRWDRRYWLPKRVRLMCLHFWEDLMIFVQTVWD